MLPGCRAPDLRHRFRGVSFFLKQSTPAASDQVSEINLVEVADDESTLTVTGEIGVPRYRVSCEKHGESNARHQPRITRIMPADIVIDARVTDALHGPSKQSQRPQPWCSFRGGRIG